MRYATSPSGRCRSCLKTFPDDRIERERLEVARVEANEAAVPRQTRAPGLPPREVVIDGEVFVVMFDGCLREPEAIH